MHLKKTISLNMIVKNEAHIIEKTFDNLANYITFDYWVISDTGSTDGTQDIIRNYFAKKNIPGELVSHEWSDFGTNRTLALQACYNKSDYLLIFDADDSIHGEFSLPTPFDKEMYSLIFGNGFTYIRPLLITNRKKWKFEGVLHEYIAADGWNVTATAVVSGKYFVESGKTGARSQDKNKYQKDAEILKKAYHKEKAAGNSICNRYAFYCAQSYKDSNQVDNAIEWYSLVADKLPNWGQEKYYACVMLGNLYRGKSNDDKALFYYLKAVEFDSERIEGVVNACEILRQRELHHIVVSLCMQYKNYNRDPKEKLFLFKDLYYDVLEFNASVSAYYTGHHDFGLENTKKILQNKTANAGVMKVSISNLKCYKTILEKEDTLDLFYTINDLMQAYNNIENVDTWNMLFQMNKSKLIAKPKKFVVEKNRSPRIFLSMTSCKRFDLFEQTVNSVMNHFLDKSLIDVWFCVDDNSSDEDRAKMKKAYPWFQFYNKTAEEKGHRPSMNIIWNKLNQLKPKYWIHIEDDFLFHTKRNFIRDSIKILESPGNVKQVLFNRNYSETMEDVAIKGDIPFVPGFVLHEQKSGSFSYKNCHYWPHYSFRPGVVSVDAILKLGNFDSPNTFFEMDYANRWVGAGYKTAFFNGIHCRHIGRLTSERSNTSLKNAYSLNNEEQFIKKSSAMKIINLKRRPDRMMKAKKVLENAGITDYEFVDAVDGKLLKPTLELKKLFANNDFGSRVGVFGCALTHYKLWKDLVADADNQYYAIFEDDIVLVPGFNNKFQAIRPEMHKYDCIMLGYHMFSRHREATKDLYVTPSDKLTLAINNKDLNIGGTFGYTINKSGAKALISYIEKNGIRHGIDYLMKICTDLKTWELRPQIVFSEWYEVPGQNVDSDIQKDTESMNFDNTVDLSTHFNFIPSLDQIGNDCYYYHGKSLHEMMEISMADPKCIGFNTLGFFKTSITKLVNSNYFGTKDGIYIKKVKSKIAKKEGTRVKMLCDWQTSDKLVKEWELMPVPSKIELTHEDNDIDYYVIINKPGKGTFNPEKTIIYQMEPTVYDTSKNWGAKTWPKIDTSKFYRIQDHRYLNGVQWNFKITDIPQKKNEVVSILSGNNWDTGHNLRTEFVKANQNLIQVYGKVNYHSVSSYKGPVPDENRFKVYSGVKYCIAAENNSEENYATEKIWEPILAEVLAFYWGCPNLEDYIDSQAFVRLPLEEPSKARAIIDQAIAEDWWSQRIDVIRSEKKKILNIYGFIPNLQRAVTRTKAVIITLKDTNDRSKMIKKITANLDKLGIDTEIFYGINGKNIVTDGNTLCYNNESYTYDPKERLNGQRMTAGEFGCAWSHMTVYKKLRDDPKYNNYLIFEDDAEMCGDLFALNDAITNLPAKYDMCHIAMTDWYPFVHGSAVNNTYFNVERKFFNRLTAYFVSKDGANKLIRDSLSLPADDLLSNMFVNGKIDVYAPKDYVFQQTKNIVSTIKTVDE